MNSDSIFALLSPADLGLPSKFTSYRQQQREALDWFFEDCVEQTSGACLPTGIGKTSFGVSVAKHYGGRTVYLVATKALQEQALAEFSETGMKSVKGRANYECDSYGDCAIGYDEECSLSDTTSCPYNQAVDVSKQSDVTITNYAYWLHARGHNKNALEYDDMDPISLLVCDEAHAVESQLTSYFGIHFAARDCAGAAKFGESGIMPCEDWTDWATNKIASCVKRKEVIKQLSPNGYKREKAWRDLDDLHVKYQRVAALGGNWCWQFNNLTGALAFEPIRLTGYMKALFSGVPRILLMSASLTPFQCGLLLGNDMPYDYRGWGPVFPPQNAPFYHIPCKKLTRHSTDEDYKELIQAADLIIGSRSDRKGIIQTVSYARTRQALAFSNHRERFLWNDTSGGLGSALDQFRRSGPGSVLVSPSVEEGFDFAGPAAEYQIILKFPFPNEGQRVIKERCNLIPNYRLGYAAQKVVQMKGRIVRYMEDRGETFILDNAVRQLAGPAGKALLPLGFRIFTVNAPPPPPPRIIQ